MSTARAIRLRALADFFDRWANSRNLGPREFEDGVVQRTLRQWANDEPEVICETWDDERGGWIPTGDRDQEER